MGIVYLGIIESTKPYESYYDDALHLSEVRIIPEKKEANHD